MNIKKILLTLISSLSMAVCASAADRSALESLRDLAGENALEAPQASQMPAGQPTMVVDTSGARAIDSLSLSDFKGSTFLQFIIAPDGMKNALDKDAAERFVFADKDVINSAAGNFDPLVYNKIVKSLVGGKTGLDNLVDSLKGTAVTPLTAAGAIAGRLKALNLAADPARLGLTAVSVAPFLSLASGGGVLVTLDSNNSFLNIGYKSGKNPAELDKDVKSGRSFGVSQGHKALDVSDKYYLQELDSYLAATRDPSPFYQALLNVLLSCDASSFSGLSPPAQAVATDFVAVYTAEIDRNAMSDFKKFPWQNDLAEATIISAYSSAERKIVVDGRLVDGTPLGFFGVGVQGSGIGIMRKDRRMLQLGVADLERTLHPELVEAVEAQIGRRGGDVIHNLMLFLNDPKNQDKVRTNSRELSKAVVAFISQMHADGPLITKNIRLRGLSLLPSNDGQNTPIGNQ